MRGYTLLPQVGYTAVYLLAAILLGVSALGTFLGWFGFGGIVWWPTFVFLLMVFVLEVHSVYVRRG
jgi:hypothetical protein